jgi:anaerobic magnesium-protoporphyrin IX monomethyl ester cyclase
VVAEFKPYVVGFSSVSSQFHFVKEMAAMIKTHFPHTIIVCGGVHPTITPDCILETNYLDGIFVGESENSFIEFLQKIEKNEAYENTDNFGYVRKGKVILNKLKPFITILDNLPCPDKEVYPFMDGIKSARIAPFLFSRGCPYLCSYCSNHGIAKIYNLPRNSPRYRSPESSIREIEETMGKFRINTVSILDDIFGLDEIWRREFCEKYKKRIKVRFLCLLRVNMVNEEFIRLLKDTGCYRVSIGIESGNNYIRKYVMNRQMSNKQIMDAFSLAHKYGLETNAINIIGIPGETEEMLWDTINLNKRVKPASSGVNIFYPYKGTKLGDYCFEKGLVDEKLYYNFANERRETTLNYPSDYKEKLVYYRENWEYLVYPFSLIRIFKRMLRKTFIWPHLQGFKRFVVSFVLYISDKIKGVNKCRKSKSP